MILDILSNAERLKIIKGTPYLITDDVLLKDFKWLVARVEEHELLERKFDALVKAAAKVDGQYATLHREWRERNEVYNDNKRLREALEFYADSQNYELSKEADKANLCDFINALDADSGHIAKSALEETK